MARSLSPFRLRQPRTASWSEMADQLAQAVRIAVLGRVSAGKSSLTNALLRRGRADRVADVGAESGVTTELESLRFDDRVRVVDSPGLEDLDAERTGVTEDYLHRVDVGILVVTGSADAAQVEHLRRLREHCEEVFVVLNKVDQWDRHGPAALDKVLAQWREALGVDRIYPTCTFGYDDDLPDDTPLDLRGIDELRADVLALLAERGKELRLARHMADKTVYAGQIIVDALRSAGGVALLPHSPVSMVAPHSSAICKLYYLYTGYILPRPDALALLPLAAADAGAASVFLAVKPLIPVPFLLEPTAARLRVLHTFALLGGVHLHLANRAPLTDRAVLRRRIGAVRRRARDELARAFPGSWKEPGFWQRLLVEISAE